MKKIESYKMLIEEQQRTLRYIDSIQDSLKRKITKTEEKVNPILGFVSGVSKSLQPSQSNFLKMGVGSLVNFVIRKRLLKNASPIVKFGGGLIGKSLIAGFILKKLVGKKKKA